MHGDTALVAYMVADGAYTGKRVIGMIVSTVHTGYHVPKLLVVSWQGILAVLFREESAYHY